MWTVQHFKHGQHIYNAGLFPRALIGRLTLWRVCNCLCCLWHTSSRLLFSGKLIPPPDDSFYKAAFLTIVGILDAEIWDKNDTSLTPLAELILSVMDLFCQWEFTENSLEAARNSVSQKIRATRRAKPGPQNIIAAYHIHVMKQLNSTTNKLTYWQLLKRILEDRVCIIAFPQPSCSTNPCSPKSMGPQIHYVPQQLFSPMVAY